MIDEGALTLFLLILARMSGFVQFNPLLSRQNFPGMFRAGFTLLLAAFTYSVEGGRLEPPAGVLPFAGAVLLELAVGFSLGMVVHFFFYIPQMAGLAIDTQMGMTMNQIYDSGSQSNMSVTGTLLNTLMILLFFAGNGHHTLLRIMLTSGQVVGYGGVSIGHDLTNLALELFIECTVLAVKLCMPVLAAELIGQLGMGVLMKVIPQINVFSINIELKVIVGLGLLLMLMLPVSEFLLEVEQTMLDSLQVMLGLAA
ncbi:MAG: flagellar biosynthetic protein FliR [Oscillibacter sp.]|jgi:flagellar biosynthetic protein FliR|uniref:flagellar biosynthetic protein FliR n=1 Tax=uncultured Oscillibacter sp. TaxID=876091 RepID=UPI00216BC396|nr:flagellar biosynthetic protein FliR [uncultured Oscillibacter sp.]MCI9644148.1 flagellar biosynthetic protein FliR [Oscillibacter sp.]